MCLGPPRPKVDRTRADIDALAAKYAADLREAERPFLHQCDYCDYTLRGGTAGVMDRPECVVCGHLRPDLIWWLTKAIIRNSNIKS